ncbi:MAG: M23 family metallopeptidase [Clostridiales bacterium]|nr:M23 family metallopeptidase [Clostridiales bacterium]
MKLNDIRITQTSGKSNGQESEVSPFSATKKKEQPRPPAHGESMFIKIGLCFAAVLAALLVRTLAGPDPEPDSAPVTSIIETDDEESLGALHFVDATQSSVTPEKWRAPVASGDIELMLDNRMVRFTATESLIRNCCPGEVLAIGEDPRLGKYVRVKHANDVETIFYGFEEIGVKQTQLVQPDDVLGTVPLGRSVYMSVLSKGAPQDPALFINLDLEVG